MRKSFWLKGFLLISLFAFAFALAGCGGGDGTTPVATSGAVTLSGSLGSGYSAASLTNGVADRVTALPNFSGLFNATSFALSKSAPINSDGTFSLSLETDKNWVLVLEDSRVTNSIERFVGYIALNAASSSLLALPISASNSTTISLGEINKTGGDTAISNTAVSASDFTLTSGQLSTLAKTDDYFKSVKNFVNNYNGATGTYYWLMPIFEFRGIYNGMDNAFATPTDYAYRSYQFNLLSNSQAITINGVCGEGAAKVKIELLPPADVTDGVGNSYGPTLSNSISNNFANCSTSQDGFIDVDEPSSIIANGSGDFYANNRPVDIYPLTIEFGKGGGDGLTGTVPAGYWQYIVDDVVTGQFDVAVATPWTGAHPITAVVPVLQVNRDGTTGLINSVDIDWYRPNDTLDGYVQITDITVLKQLISLAVFELENYSDPNSRRYDQILFDPSEVTSIAASEFASGDWYWSGVGPAADQAWGIHLSYVSGGINLFFSNHNPRF